METAFIKILGIGLQVRTRRLAEARCIFVYKNFFCTPKSLHISRRDLLHFSTEDLVNDGT